MKYLQHNVICRGDIKIPTLERPFAKSKPALFKTLSIKVQPFYTYV